MSALTAAEIARALGGRKSGAGWVCKCVAHDDRNPSLSFSQGDDGRVLVHCHAGCDPRDVIAELRNRGLWPGNGQHPNREPGEGKRTPEQRLGDALRRWQKDTADQRADAEFADRAWRRGIDPGRTSAIDYLKRRKLELDDGIAGRVVRYLEDCPRGQDKVPAMLVRFAPIVHPAETVPWGEDPPVTCIQRIFLDPVAPKGHGGKWVLGHPFSLPLPFLRDGVVVTGPSEPLLAMKLSPDEEVTSGLHLVEGFETGLASMMAGFRPLWATYSAQAMARFPVLPGIEALTILADHDQAGLLAGQSCAERWMTAGREVLIRWPDGLGDDYADEV